MHVQLHCPIDELRALIKTERNPYVILRDHYWSNRCFVQCSDLEEAAINGWRKTCDKAERVKSICGVSYLWIF
jgi:hypothetical protein